MRSLPLKLPPGSDLRLSLEQLALEEMASGFVLGIVGNLARAAFQCPGRQEPTVLEGNLEIITLNGTISPNGVHLHLSLSDSDCQVWGGHLEPGTIVLKGADLLVGFHEHKNSDTNTIFKLDPAKPPRIEIAVLPGCPWCARALRILQSLDVPHVVNQVDSEEAFKAFQNRSEVTKFPQLFLDGEYIGGYESLTELRASGKLNQL